MGFGFGAGHRQGNSRAHCVCQDSVGGAAYVPCQFQELLGGGSEASSLQQRSRGRGRGRSASGAGRCAVRRADRRAVLRCGRYAMRCAANERVMSVDVKAGSWSTRARRQAAGSEEGRPGWEGEQTRVPVWHCISIWARGRRVGASARRVRHEYLTRSDQRQQPQRATLQRSL